MPEDGVYDVEYKNTRTDVVSLLPNGVEVERRPRDVVHCPLGHKLHSDLNGALNILRKAANLVVSTVRKPLSFLVEHNRVAP
jgi:hypothetical protein